MVEDQAATAMAKSKAQDLHGKKRKIQCSSQQGSKKLKKAKVEEFVAESSSKDAFGDLLLAKLAVQMPDDFFHFWDFVSQHMDIFDKCGLTFMGPFDLLNGKIGASSRLTSAELHLHGRHYFDPPELMSVIGSKDSGGFHIGYFRDSPNANPAGLVWSKVSSGGILHQAGGNLFAAIANHCQFQMRGRDPIARGQYSSLLSLVKTESTRLRYALTPSLSHRFKGIQSPTFHKFGIVVPVDKTGLGYRELPIADEDLLELLARIDSETETTTREALLDELQEIVTLVHFANDECDYGMGLELGLDLFIHGSALHHGLVQSLLTLAYQLLKRDLYAEVLELHLAKRSKDCPIDQSKSEA